MDEPLYYPSDLSFHALISSTYHCTSFFVLSNLVAMLHCFVSSRTLRPRTVVDSLRFDLIPSTLIKTPTTYILGAVAYRL